MGLSSESLKKEVLWAWESETCRGLWTQSQTENHLCRFFCAVFSSSFINSSLTRRCRFVSFPQTRRGPRAASRSRGSFSVVSTWSWTSVCRRSEVDSSGRGRSYERRASGWTATWQRSKVKRSDSASQTDDVRSCWCCRFSSKTTKVPLSQTLSPEQKHEAERQKCSCVIKAAKKPAAPPASSRYKPESFSAELSGLDRQKTLLYSYRILHRKFGNITQISDFDDF